MLFALTTSQTSHHDKLPLRCSTWELMNSWCEEQGYRTYNTEITLAVTSDRETKHFLSLYNNIHHNDRNQQDFCRLKE